MIQLYGFYSLGGYKDMYFGDLSPKSCPTFYMPLLGIMKRSDNPTDVDQAKELEKLPQIKILRKQDIGYFPEECNKLFSHGGYAIQYRTLNNGYACLAISCIENQERDEVGRAIPFSLAFIATTATDQLQLDSAAIWIFQNTNLINKVFSPCFSYDPKVNGLRCDLDVIYRWLESTDGNTRFVHKSGRVNYVIVNDSNSTAILEREQGIKSNDIDCLALSSGKILKGALNTYDKTLDKPTVATQPTDEEKEKGVGTPAIDGFKKTEAKTIATTESDHWEQDIIMEDGTPNDKNELQIKDKDPTLKIFNFNINASKIETLILIIILISLIIGFIFGKII